MWTRIFPAATSALPLPDGPYSPPPSGAPPPTGPPAPPFPPTWVPLRSLAAGNFWKAFQSGYDAMPDKELKQRVRWDVYLLVLRAIAMFIMAAHGLAIILVPLMALLLSYLEIWPERALGAVFGDPSRLYEYDPDNPASRAGADTDGNCGVGTSR